MCLWRMQVPRFLSVAFVPIRCNFLELPPLLSTARYVAPGLRLCSSFGWLVIVCFFPFSALQLIHALPSLASGMLCLKRGSKFASDSGS